MGFKTRVKACPICGAEFETAKPNKKYCSILCREAGRKINMLEWEQKNPEYRKNYMNEYRRRNKKENI